MQRKIQVRIENLARDPRAVGSIKLVGRETYRVRVGDYRIIYGIRDQHMIIIIVEVGHRRDVYDDK